MKSFILGCIAAIAIALGGSFALENLQQPSAHAYATSGVRL